jgi:hypothetical protein
MMMGLCGKGYMTVEFTGYIYFERVNFACCNCGLSIICCGTPAESDVGRGNDAAYASEIHHCTVELPNVNTFVAATDDTAPYSMCYGGGHTTH